MSSNLLPPQTRENILYARRNTRMLRWITAMLVGLVGVMMVVLAGLFYIDQTTQNVSKQVDQARHELKIQKLEETQKRVEDMSSSFKLVTQVLSKQVLFSEVLKQAGAVMPSGASLSSLSIEQLGGGIDLEVKAVDYQAASQVQVNLEDPTNKLFEKVDIVNINCDSTTSTDPIYHCTGLYRALFTKNTPFLFLNSASGDTP